MVTFNTGLLLEVPLIVTFNTGLLLEVPLIGSGTSRSVASCVNDLLCVLVQTVCIAVKMILQVLVVQYKLPCMEVECLLW